MRDFVQERLTAKEMPVYAGLEAGGTKFVCMVGSGPHEVRAQMKFPTAMPEKTLGIAIDFFKAHGPFSAMGIGTFGPCDLDPASPTYGSITGGIKPGWENVNILGSFRQAFDVPMAIDTDVNAAAFGEWKWGAGKGLDTLIYLTVGTGIGGGGIHNGKIMHGLMHPEMGHIRVPRISEADRFPGTCPYHGDCIQGLAAGPAIQARWGKAAEELPSDHPAWEMEASYLALAVANYICVLSPQRVILGGGVMKQGHLFSRIRREVQRLLNGYLPFPLIRERIDEYIIPPALGEKAGVLGAIALAQQSAEMAKG